MNAPKKLHLHKETLKALSSQEVAPLNGGIMMMSLGCTAGDICTAAITSYVGSCSLCFSVVLECHQAL